MFSIRRSTLGRMVTVGKSVVLKVRVAGREHGATNVRHLVAGKTQLCLGALCQCSEHSKTSSSLVKLGELHVDEVEFGRLYG